MPRHAQTSPTSRWQPTWRRVGTTSVGAFVVVLGFLAGRMSGGADPALIDSATAKRPSARQKAVTSTPSTSSAPVAAPGSSSATTDSTTDYSSAAQDPSPPTTQSS
jgi:hypothetical protein